MASFPPLNITRDQSADLGKIRLEALKARFHTAPTPWITGCATAQVVRADAARGGRNLDLDHEFLEIGHVEGECAKRHTTDQAPIDTLRDAAPKQLSGAMASDFKTALEWHLKHHGTTIAELVAGTGVSRDVINKIRARPNASTTVENGLLIAAYYGKTINQFVACDDVDTTDQVNTLIELLPPQERRIVLAQIKALVGQPKH